MMISTCDSSVNYTYLCNYENDEGNPGSSCGEEIGPLVGEHTTDVQGVCVFAPLQKDIDKWNEDKDAWDEYRQKHEKHWPVASGVISGGYRCWSGIRPAIYPGQIDADWATDTYGDMEYSTGGIGPNERITIYDLKDMFALLVDKHELEENQPFGFLFVIDNTGSISLSQWQTDARTDFLQWIEDEYPQCQVREITLSNYLVDGEDWLRHFKQYYEETVSRGHL
ncbi:MULTISPECIES: hypothetical protein [Pirellulaceae]|uniref:hypothetical protein n=1 Tax=Pirellulaceae TaxID=2691357 RepID=UPI0011B03B74|nr:MULTISPECIES: hypothetical protein [Pirellulaceae]